MKLSDKIRLEHGLLWGVRDRVSDKRLAVIVTDALLIILALFALLAVYGWVGAEEYAEQQRQQAAALEPALNIVKACVSEVGAGGVVQIGDEFFLCGLSPLGSFR